MRYVRPPNGGFSSVCGCLSGDTSMPTHSCTEARKPFHPDLRDDICRGRPDLLPNSWRARPAPADLRKCASAPDIPDTDKPPEECPCLCGETFSTEARLLLHVHGVHGPGTVHHAGLHTLQRVGGAYAAYDADTHEVVIAGMGRFLVQSGDTPSSTLGESRTILKALIHAARRIPWVADQNISVRTGSMSSTQGSQRPTQRHYRKSVLFSTPNGCSQWSSHTE